MSPYLAEFLGTAMLIFLGNGIVSNSVLNQTKGHQAGILFIAFGWAFAVMVSALIFAPFSGAHFNPALTVAFATAGTLPWSMVGGYVVAQVGGAILGACLVYIQYKDHFDATKDKEAILSAFSTGPAIRNFSRNFISEWLATFILVFAVFGINHAELGVMNTFGVGGLIFVIGVGLGGTTGYAINPARDLGPRIAHAFLPIRHKGHSDWAYSWIPVVAPLVAAVTAAFCASALFIY